MNEPLIDRRQRPDRRRGPWLLTLLVTLGWLGAELRGQPFRTECARAITLATDPSFEDPPESLRYEWRDGRGTVVGRGSQLTLELPVGTHTYVSVVTAPGDRTAEATTTVVVEDTRPPDLGVGRRVLRLPTGAADDTDVDLVAAMRVTADDACDPDPPAVTWDPPPPYPAGDTTVTFAATDQAGNRASTQAVVRVTAEASGSPTVPGRGTVPASPAPSSGADAGALGAPGGPDTPADVRVSGGPARVANPAIGLPTGGADPGLAIGLPTAGADPGLATGLPTAGADPGVATGLPTAGADPGLPTGERAGGSDTSPRATSPAATTALARGRAPAVFGIGIPASGFWWGGVALGVGMLLVAWLLVTRRSTRSPRTATATPIVFHAVAKPNLNAVHSIRPSYVPPRYRLDLRPHGAVGTHAIVQSDETPASHEEP